MTASRTFLLSLALLLAACKPAAPTNVDTAAATAPATIATPATEPMASKTATGTVTKACVAEDFAGFLKRFTDDIAVQRATTVDPLGESSLDAEGKVSTKYLTAAEIKFPVIFNSQEQAAQGLVQKIAEPAADQRVVTVAQADTDVQTTYTFMADPCWKLVGLSDDTPHADTGANAP